MKFSKHLTDEINAGRAFVDDSGHLIITIGKPLERKLTDQEVKKLFPNWIDGPINIAGWVVC